MPTRQYLNTCFRDNKIVAMLTKREKEVFRLIVDGFENKAIAKKLFISVKTVEFHKVNIKQKLGVTTVKDLYRLNFSR